MTDTTPTYKPGDVANGHVLAESGQWLPVGAPIPTGHGPKAKKPIWTRWWMIVLYAFVGIMIISAVASAGSDPKTDDPSSSPKTEEPVVEEPVVEEPVVEEPVVEEPDLSAGQANALESAENYLSFSAFSREGLIEQLKFEGYSTKNATFGVDSVNANWKKQAAKSAENYLSFTSFSRSGLIEQLEFEGYTNRQAEYGVNKAGL